MGLGKKLNYRKTSGPHGAAARKARRRIEAEERNAKYAALSLDEKIAQQMAHREAIAPQRIANNLTKYGDFGKQLKKLLALKEKAK